MMFFSGLSKRFAWLALILVCAGSFALMLYASHTDSAIMDELAHIPAGYGYVHNLDYRLNPEHPPLVKALAMLPVLFLNPTFPTNTAAWQTEVNGQWDMGYQFLYNAGNDANAIIQTARIFPILLTILLIVLIYLFARRLIGNWWALLPAFLIAFDPTVLAHGHYVTTDVGATFGVLLSLFFFTRYIEAPSTKNLWLAGLSFGIAMIVKFSTPLLVILYIFLFLILWIRDIAVQKKKALASFFRHLWHLIAIGLIGYLVIVYPVYFLFTIHYPVAKQVSDTTYILGSFADGPTVAGQACHGLRCLADLDIKMAGNPVLRPFAEYALGILMVLQRADGGNTIYFLGHVAGSGGPIYFPLLYLLKEPIPTLLIVFLALILAAWWIIKRAKREPRRMLANFFDYIGVSFTEFSMASFVILYWGYSVQSPLNIGLRHILPTLPLIAILATVVWKKWVFRFNFSGGASMISFAAIAARTLARAAAKYILLILLIAWLFLETLFAAPYFLSYFNELGGGIWNGYHYVTDSNYDWGQDLSRLQAFVAAHPEMDKIAVDYFGGGNPKYTLGAREIDWSSSKGNPALQNIHWLAVSVNTLEGATQPLGPGQTRNPQDEYSWLTTLRPPKPGMGNVPQPDFRIGTSIFVYHL
jgi:4-amino-4-deoxy-L-arabinose transferase-like glycosyltransferase